MGEVGDLATELAGKYRVLGKLGSGAGGDTYEAIAELDGAKVALKRLVLATTSDWKKVELFQREARVLASLSHPAIPKHRESFVVETSGGSVSYLAHDFAPGKSLRQWVESGWHPTDAEIIQIASFLLETLAYLHALHPPVIHRDIKPANVIRGDDGKLWLVDFGAVRDAMKDDVGGSTVVGTYGYMAPEQFRGQALPTSDIYGVGATILYLLGGKAPTDYPQENLKVSFRSALRVSPFLARWLDHALEPTPEKRFADARDALAVLRGQKRVAAPAAKPSNLRVGLLIGALMLLIGVVGVTVVPDMIRGLAKKKEPLPPTAKAALPKQLRSLPERPYNTEYEPTRKGRTFDGRHTNIVYDLSIAHDDKLVASSSDRIVKVWDIATGKELHSFGGFDGKVFGVAFTADDKRIVGVGDTGLRVIDAASGNEVGKLALPNTQRVALTKDGATAYVSGYDGAVHVIDLAAVSERAKYVQSGPTSALALSADDKRLAVGLKNGDAAILATNDGSAVATWSPHPGKEVDRIAFTPDGSAVASGGDDFRIAVTAIRSSGSTTLDTEYYATNEVWGVAFSPDGRLLVATSRDKTVSIISMPQRWRAERHDTNVPSSSAQFTHDGSTLIFAAGGQLGSMQIARYGSKTTMPATRPDATGAPTPKNDEQKHFLDAMSLALGQRTREMQVIVTSMLAANPQSQLAWIANARLALLQGHLHDAEYSPGSVSLARAHIDRAASLGPKTADWWACAAWVARAEKDYPGAREAIRQTFALVPREPSATLCKADLDQREGDPASAIASLRDLIAGTKRTDVLARAYLLLAMAYKDAGDLEGADLAWQQPIALAPNDAWAHGNYAQFLIQANAPDKALVEAKAAMALMDYPIGRNILARAHVAVGNGLLWEQHRVDEAIREYGEAIGLTPLATAYYGRAAAYRFRALDGHDPSFLGKARVDLNEALKLEPTWNLAQQALAELDQVTDRATK